MTIFACRLAFPRVMFKEKVVGNGISEDVWTRGGVCLLLLFELTAVLSFAKAIHHFKVPLWLLLDYVRKPPSAWEQSISVNQGEVMAN